MKKITFMLAVAAAVLSGCSKETQEIQEESQEESQEVLSTGPETISASMGDVSTKVTMTDNGSAVSYTWKSGDKILFVNPNDATDSVKYIISDGIGGTTATFTKSTGEFTPANTYVCCQLGNGVYVSASGEFIDKNAKPILKGQNPTYIGNYMVFAGYTGSPTKKYSFKGSEIPTSFSFEAPFTMLKVSVSNTSSAAVTPNGIKVDGGQGSNYFLGTLKVNATSGVAASGAMDYLQMAISSGSEIAAGGTGAYSFMCVQNSPRTFSSLKVSIFY